MATMQGALLHCVGLRTRPRNRIVPVSRSRMRNRNARSTLTSMGGGGSGEGPMAITITAAVAAAASVTALSTPTNLQQRTDHNTRLPFTREQAVAAAAAIHIYSAWPTARQPGSQCLLNTPGLSSGPIGSRWGQQIRTRGSSRSG